MVTTLFEANRALQVELKCPPEKIAVILNGVNAKDFDACLKKEGVIFTSIHHIYDFFSKPYYICYLNIA